MMVALAIGLAPSAAADPGGNNQSPTVLCRDADYADLHPTLCDGAFGLRGGGGGNPGGGSDGGLLGGILGTLHSLTGGIL